MTGKETSRARAQELLLNMKIREVSRGHVAFVAGHASDTASDFCSMEYSRVVVLMMGIKELMEKDQTKFHADLYKHIVKELGRSREILG